MKPWTGRLLLLTPAIMIIAVGASLWTASNQLLFPSWKGASKDFTVYPSELARAWGKSCGSLRLSHTLHFNEVAVPSLNGGNLPGWLIRADENGHDTAVGAIMLIHGGGSDRREVSRHIPFFLGQGLDVLAVDLTCHGEAPCPSPPGLTYGHLESQDVLSTYLFLDKKYTRVFAMGSSVGAASVLIALPAMPHLAGVIAENPMESFQRLIRENPVSRTIPQWFTNVLLDLTMLRGLFNSLLTPGHSLALVHTTPIYFIHGRQDEIVPYQQSEELAAHYTGPKHTWWPEQGGHSSLWEANRAEYERRLAVFLAKGAD